ncbi:hypothetical protein PVL29_020621 [Vitis rotundifolia]|uniref:Ubiquitin-like protease family profile domain-containing protein n=2 Tax=Vitis rotundifolia TaxID=103349 RepID=A0AA38YXK7_VITRO|nr:hypothetical protein PVL29_020621 [Vitis rotundifolia]
MVKKKLRNSNAPIDLASADSESYLDYSKHRSCWRHMVAHLHAQKKRMTKREIEEIKEIFEFTTPCFSNTFPHHERSKRRTNCKNIIIHKEKKKLDTAAFEWYFRNLWKSFSDDKKSSFGYLDCLWFSFYLKTSSREKVLNWIKKKRIFSKKYVFVPIVCWNHWSLLILCHFGESLESKIRAPCMLLLDSLQMANPKRLEPNIRKFVFDIYKEEGRPESKQLITKIPMLVPKVPQQRNGEECGNFVLYFINLFMDGAPENFSVSEGYPYFMKKNWFGPEALEHFFRKLDSIPKLDL